MPSPYAYLPARNSSSERSQSLGLFLRTIMRLRNHYYVGGSCSSKILPLYWGIWTYLSGCGTNLLSYKSVHWPAKFDLVHQTVLLYKTNECIEFSYMFDAMKELRWKQKTTVTAWELNQGLYIVWVASALPTRTEVFVTTCAVDPDDFEGWWLPGGCSSSEHCMVHQALLLFT